RSSRNRVDGGNDRERPRSSGAAREAADEAAYGGATHERCFSVNTNDRNRLAHERTLADPQRGVNHAAAVARILERRIRALEVAVAALQSDRSNRVEVHDERKMTNHAVERPMR